MGANAEECLYVGVEKAHMGRPGAEDSSRNSLQDTVICGKIKCADAHAGHQAPLGDKCYNEVCALKRALSETSEKPIYHRISRFFSCFGCSVKR